jgi:hypothetical protein
MVRKFITTIGSNQSLTIQLPNGGDFRGRIPEYRLSKEDGGRDG